MNQNIDDIKNINIEKMDSIITSLLNTFKKIRTNRVNPNILDEIFVLYYGSKTPITQLANITIENARTLIITPWENKLIPLIEKEILKSDINLYPTSNNSLIRITVPILTEETRKDYIRQTRKEAEITRISIRNIRRESKNQIKDNLKNKIINEDYGHHAEKIIQNLTNHYIQEIDKHLLQKEQDLLKI